MDGKLIAAALVARFDGRMDLPDILSEEALSKRIKKGEDSLTEFKPAGVNNYELEKTLVAFANSVPEHDHAVLFVGVANNGEILGLGATESDSLQKTITKITTKKIYPQITHTTRLLEIEGETVLAVVIGFNNERPHFAGPAYVRIGTESIDATAEVYRDLINSRTDKVRKILSAKGKAVTLTVPNRLGTEHFVFLSCDDSFQPTPPPAESHRSALVRGLNPRLALEAYVVAADHFCIRLRSEDGLNEKAVPLANLSVTWDTVRDRLKLDLHL